MTVDELIERLERIKKTSEDIGDYDVCINDVLYGFSDVERVFENISPVTDKRIIQLN